MKNIKKIFLALILLAFVSFQQVNSADVFQNNLLKAEILKNSFGNIKIVLYTSKPFNDSVFANKKSDYEYIILMPETANSLTVKPSLQNVSDIVKNIEVKTQQYQNNIKGYTKIVISTTKPVEIIPQVQTLKPSDYRVNENDYKELLSQTSKKQSQAKTSTTPKKEIVKSVPKNVALVAKPAKNVSKSIEQSKTSNEVKFKKANITKPVMKSEKISKPINKEIKTPKMAVKTKAQNNPEVQKNVIPKYEAPKVFKEEQKIIAPTVTPVVKEVSPAHVKTSNLVEAPKINEVKEAIPVNTAKTSKLHRYKVIILNNIYAVFGAALAIFILLLLIAKKMTQNIKKRKEIFMSHLEEKPEPATDYTEKISDDMTWQEKFQTYVDKSSSSAAEGLDIYTEEGLPESITSPSGQSFDEQLGEELNELFSSEPEETSENEMPQDKFAVQESFEEELSGDFQISQTNFDEFEALSSAKNMEEDLSIDDLLGEEDVISNVSGFDYNVAMQPDTQDVLAEASMDEFVEEPSEIIRSEFVIDDVKGFYLVDFEDTTALIGHIEDEIFVLKRFNQKIQGSLKARMDEKRGNTTSYMTKVGEFKGLVEVSPKNMKLLIEL